MFFASPSWNQLVGSGCLFGAAFWKQLSVFVSIFCTPLLLGQWVDITANTPGALAGAEHSSVLATEGQVYVLGDRGVYRSTDNGATFTALNDVSGQSYDLSIDQHRFLARAGDFIYTGTDPGSLGINNNLATLHRIRPNETSWSQASPIFISGSPQTSVVDHVAFDASTGTYYAASPFRGAYVSSDGLTWTERSAGLPGAGGNLILGDSVTARNGRAILAYRTGTTGAYFTNEAGSPTWVQVPSFPAGSTSAPAVFGDRLVTSSAGGILPESGAYVSVDNGLTWQQRDTLKSHAFTIEANSSYLFAFTSFSTTGSVLQFSATNGDSFDDLDAAGLPMGFAPVWVEPTETHVFVLIRDGEAARLFRRPISEFDLTPSTKVVVLEPQTTQRSFNVGDSFAIESLGAGSGTVSYQWQKDGQNLVGQTAARLNLTNLQLSDAGSYAVVVTSASGTATSAGVAIGVLPRGAGYQDLSFRPAGDGFFPRAGFVMVYPDRRVLQLDGNVAMLFSPEGALLAQRVDNDARWRRAFFNANGRLAVWGEFGLVHLDPDTLADASPVDSVNFPGTFVQVNDVEEIPGRGYLFALHESARLNGTQDMPGVALFDYEGNFISVFGDTIVPNNRPDESRGLQLARLADGRLVVGYGRSSFGLPPDRTSPLTLDERGEPAAATFTPARQGTYFPQADGTVIVLSRSGSVSRIHKLRADGSLDPSFTEFGSGRGATSILDLAVTANGKILIVGEFETAAGVEARGHALLNADGTLDQGYYSARGFITQITPQDTVNVAFDPAGFAYFLPESRFPGFQQSGQKGIVRVFLDPQPLHIFSQPLTRRILPGTPVTLEAAAFGPDGATLTYQWFRDGQAVTGQTNRVLSLPSFGAADNGTWTYTVSDGTATVTSNPFDLSLRGLPTITALTGETNLGVDETLRLEVALDDTNNVTYQWTKDGTPLAGQTSSVLEIPNLTTADAGSYRVLVTNSLGTVRSDPQPVRVNKITGQPWPGLTPANVTGFINAQHVLPDGSYFLGGDFTVDGVRRYLVKIAADGTLIDTPLNTAPGGPNSNVGAISPSRDGQSLFITGTFTQYGGENRSKIVKIDLNGALDTSFSPTEIPSRGGFFTVAELPDGRLVLGGAQRFFTAGSFDYLSTYDADGSNAGNFLTLEPNGTVDKAVALPDGSVVIAGRFNFVGREPLRQIARFLPDGTLDPAFSQPNVLNQISDFSVLEDGKILVLGSFTFESGGKSYRGLMRLNNDGSVDSTFAATNDRIQGFGSRFDVHFDGSIHVPANVQSAGANPVLEHSIARLSPDGAFDRFFQPGLANVRPTSVRGLPSGRLYVSGGFNQFEGEAVPGHLSVTTTTADLFISSQPVDLVVDLGASATFEVTALGSSALTYQWLKDGVELAGENSATLTLGNVMASDRGQYAVRVTNDSGSELSSPARLEVLADPVLRVQPTSLTATLGGGFSLSVEAIGASPLTYQWQRNGVDISGATSAMYMSNATADASGCYTVTVTNALGSVVSQPAAVSVQAILGQLSLVSDDLGSAKTMAVLPDGSIALGAGTTSPWIYARVSSSGQIIDSVTSLSDARSISKMAVTPAGDQIAVAGLGRRGASLINLDGSVVFSTNNAVSVAATSDAIYFGAFYGSNPGIRKFSYDGTRDVAFGTGTAGQEIISIEILSSGAVVAASSSAQVAAFLPDGSVDPNFTNPLRVRFPRRVQDLVALPNGDFLGAGTFQVTANNQENVAQFGPDGTVRSAPGNISQLQPDHILPDRDGVIIGGSFSTTTGGKTLSNLARLQPNGAVDETFGPFEGLPTVQDLAVDAMGNILVLAGADLYRLTLESDLPLSFTCQPETTETRLLTAALSGVGPFSYQWQRDGSDIAGATSESYQVPAADSGTFTVVVTTPNGDFTSNGAVFQGAIDPFETFTASLPGNQRGEKDNPDGDDFPNLLEFAYGTAPGQMTPASVLTRQVRFLGGGEINAIDGSLGLDPAATYYVVDLALPKDSRGVTLTPQATQNLADFNDGSAQIRPLGTLMGLDATYDLQPYVITPAVQSGTQLFWRQSAAR